MIYPNNSILFGATLQPLNSKQCNSWLDWLTSKGPQPEETHDVKWALAHCCSGVTWGFLENGGWRLGSEMDSQLCPFPTSNTVQEVRLFGAFAEVLIWKMEQELRGRILCEQAEGVENELQPLREARILRGTPENSQENAFRRYTDRGGAQQLVPSTFPGNNFYVRHYLQENNQTGAVRIAASRLLTTIS